jgi:DMATS type aromatic prenyltransferase
MATSKSSETAVGGSKAVEYWSQYFRTSMTPLFEAVGGYSAEQIKQHLAFIDEHVAPVIGPVPSEPYGRFDKPFCPCPMEASVNLTTKGKPSVRYWINPGKPLDPSYLEAGNVLRQAEVLRGVANATGADTRWMECLLGRMLPSPEQLDGMRSRQAASKGPVWPFCQFGFDFRGSDKIMRSYFPCIPKAGMNRTEVCINAVNSLEPLGEGLKSAMDLCTA